MENRLEDARRYFEAVIENHHAARFTPAVDSFLNLALVHQAQGDSQRANQIVLDAALAIRNRNRDEQTPQLASLSAHLALLQGRMDAAFAWLDQASREPRFVPNAVSHTPSFTAIRILLAEGSASQSRCRRSDASAHAKGHAPCRLASSSCADARAWRFGL